MATARAEALTHLANRPFSTLAAETGQATTDVANGWKGPIDGALRAIGVPEADLATYELTTADRPIFLAYVRLFALEQIRADFLALAVKTTVSGDLIDPAARVAGLDRLLVEARAAVAAAGSSGVPLTGTLTQTAPILAPAGQTDPNDRRYRGDALLR